MKLVVTGRIQSFDMVSPKPFDTPLSIGTAEVVIVTAGGDFHEPKEMGHRARGEYKLRTSYEPTITALRNALRDGTPITITVSIPEF